MLIFLQKVVKNLYFEFCKSMRIQNNNNQSFGGIKISSAKFEDVREVAFDLKRTGFLNLGHKTIYCNNNISDKIKVAQQIRKQSGFYDREFGTVIFPLSNEAYIMADPCYEQLMFHLIKQYDKDAVLNLLI